MKYRRRKKQNPKLVIILIAIAVIILLLTLLIRSTPQSSAKNVIDDFYKHEQKGDFGNSWELFHPLMKEKFSKSDYIQQRNHVFVGHFGVESFSYQVGKAKEVKKWKMDKSSNPIQSVYKVPISQTYKSSFGTFTLNQDIFATKEKGDWVILWSYQ